MRVRVFYKAGDEELYLGDHLKLRFEHVPRKGEEVWCPGQPQGGRSGWEVVKVGHLVGTQTDRHVVALAVVPLNEGAEAIVARAREAA